MTPYYNHAGITIYLGDCREIMPSLDFDVLVTDPPYGVGFSGKATKHTTKRTGGYTTEDDGSVGLEAVEMALSKARRGVVYTGIRRMYAYPVPDDIGCVFCPSGAGIGVWGFVCFHPVLYYGKRPTSALVPTSISSFATNDMSGHPCPKPLPWMLWSVKVATEESDVILDPFSGSGTTLEAAKKLNRKAIGIEIEEKYCELAAKRLSQEVMSFE